MTHDFTLPLTGGVLLDADGTIHFKLSISATRVEEEQADFQLEEVHSTYVSHQEVVKRTLVLKFVCLCALGIFSKLQFRCNQGEEYWPFKLEE